MDYAHKVLHSVTGGKCYEQALPSGQHALEQECWAHTREGRRAPPPQSNSDNIPARRSIHRCRH